MGDINTKLKKSKILFIITLIIIGVSIIGHLVLFFIGLPFLFSGDWDALVYVAMLVYSLYGNSIANFVALVLGLVALFSLPKKENLSEKEILIISKKKKTYLLVALSPILLEIIQIIIFFIPALFQN